MTRFSLTFVLPNTPTPQTALVPPNLQVGTLRRALLADYDLPVADDDGAPLDYYFVSERTGVRVPDDQTFMTARVLWGDSLTAVAQKVEAPNIMGSVADLCRALVVALAHRNDQPRDAYARIDSLYTTLVRTALDSDEAETALDAIQEARSLDFLADYPVQRLRQCRLLCDLARELADQRRYAAAMEAALIAQVFDPNDTHAYHLSILGRDGQSFETAVNPAERVRVGAAILKLDPSYGKIADDMQRTFGGRSAQGSSPVPRVGQNPRQTEPQIVPPRPDTRPPTANRAITDPLALNEIPQLPKKPRK